MSFRTLIAALVLVFAGLVSAGPAVAAPVHASAQTCTKTSSGSCIRGGQFCPQSSYGKSGYDVRGRRYVCKGDRTHPHWMVP